MNGKNTRKGQTRSRDDSGVEILHPHYDSLGMNTTASPALNTSRGKGPHRRSLEQHAENVNYRDAPSAGLDQCDSRAFMMERSMGVINMALNSLYQEFHVPLCTNTDGLFDMRPPSYYSLTEAKSIISEGDNGDTDNTDIKALGDDDGKEEEEDYVYPKNLHAALRRTSNESLNDNNLQYLLGSLGDLHRKVDCLQGKMNGLIRFQDPEDPKAKDNPSVVRQPIEPTPNTRNIKQVFEGSTVYIQTVENTYCNLQKIHFPWIPKNYWNKSTSPFPQQPSCKPASTQTEESDEDKIRALESEVEQLKLENALLKARVASLSPRSPSPHPIPAPRLCSTSTTPIRSMSEGETRPELPHYIPRTCVPGRPTTPPSHAPLQDNFQVTEVTFEWTIRNYRFKFDQQRRGNVVKTVSDPFFTSHRGYRGQMEAYLYGDGPSRGKNLSVFLRILPGKNDASLSWPVHLKLAVMLVNQTDDRRGSIKTVVEHRFPQPSNSVDSNSGDCWGVIDLASHDTIRSDRFALGDKLVLQCRVHILTP